MCDKIKRQEKMKIVISIDSFKGSLTSMEAGKAAKKGVLRGCPSAKVKVCPLADGGEGTVEALVDGMGGKMQFLTVTVPLGAPRKAGYGLIRESKTAVIEMAAAAGLTLIPKKQRNPLYTTTYGVGEMIRDAIGKGCRNFIIGIGGSSTNDGGIGMLQALGFSFQNKDGEVAVFGAIGLKDMETISRESVMEELEECNFRIACDVTNPLCGKNGCSSVFGAQKGATHEMIEEMDVWMKQYAALAKRVFPEADESYPGTGAAGGLGFAFHAFTNAVLESGIKIVMDETKLEEQIQDADLVITGEGRLDGQTAMGRLPLVWQS